MIVDVSEIKDFRHCKRKWELGSRNSFHLRPIVTPTAFKLGTVFHECLHKLYLGKDIEEVTKYLEQEMQGSDPKDAAMLRSMIIGYDREIMPHDDHFEVLDIEHHFTIKPFDLLDNKNKALVAQLSNEQLRYFSDLEISGSIDMIALDTDTNQVWGFEHKTAKNFRNEVYLWMDEQPRLYNAALKLWVNTYNAKLLEKEDKTCHNPPLVKLGGVYINEVRKLVRAFEAKRSTLKYPEDDMRNFLMSFVLSCAECHKYVTNPEIPRIPTPDLMACQNCQYNTICQTFQYQNLTKDKVLTEFKLEFEERKQDHLDDKTEVVANP